MSRVPGEPAGLGFAGLQGGPVTRVWTFEATSAVASKGKLTSSTQDISVSGGTIWTTCLVFYHIMISSAGECRNMILSPSDPLCLKVYKDFHSFWRPIKGHQSAFFPGLTVYLLKLQWGVHLRTGDSFSQSTLLRARMSFAAKPGKKGLLLPNNVKPQKQGLEQP